jgi:hypothetical protein
VSYIGDSCGEYKEYGEMLSTCCLNSDDTLAVLYCAGGFSLTSQTCQPGFSCVERMGITSEKRDLVPYAQCEMTEN